jgi:hypothetical protein
MLPSLSHRNKSTDIAFTPPGFSSVTRVISNWMVNSNNVRMVRIMPDLQILAGTRKLLFCKMACDFATHTVISLLPEARTPPILSVWKQLPDNTDISKDAGELGTAAHSHDYDLENGQIIISLRYC